MSRPTKRAYSSAVRQAQAADTRRRILRAADELFGVHGYARTTIARIADRAGVASDTVYAIFGTKGRVLTALLDIHLVHGADVANELDLPEAKEIRDETDQRRQIALYVRFHTSALDRIERVYAIMRDAAAVDEEMSSIFFEMQTYRARNVEKVVRWIGKRGALRTTKARASQIAWALTSPEVASMLRGQQGWSTDEYTAWLEDALAHALLD